MKWVILSLVAFSSLVVHDAFATHLVAQQTVQTGSDVAERQRFLSETKIEELRASRRRLDAATVLATNHKSNLTNVAVNTYPGYLFDNVKCVLAPETTQEFFYVSGKLYRQDITENETGISLTTELQFIDVNTCTAISNLWIDFWHSNAAGVYSELVGSNAGESSEASNVDTTFLRGLVQTDSYGLASFKSIFPGHYAGRAPHIDVLARYDGTFENNNTYSGGSTVHSGEIFFDQDLIAEVEGTDAYASNAQNLTLNTDDEGLLEAAASSFDPIVEYALLGDTVQDGVFAWISIGVDLTASNGR
ncbi:hypothetical protein BBJ29_005561 [Phytophthora kernoviae]|uniref:Intradiol ring-cleavage dioxygenases domain-containing protein n=1 Tax=Phytophthora kernoviae TaxID=325452 RepID=A0A3F2RKW7_9STRA|nr:hypothetical protein BBJ29_005561 [Phytophthora kernoviae]RLN59396.1 hypothetical protein BBP00_00006539 [Phytophthora kernoviae]